MEFNITRTGWYKTSPLDAYPVLSKYEYHETKDNGFFEKATITINSIEELVALSKKTNHELIVSADHDLPPSIEIYDDWRE